MHGAVAAVMAAEVDPAAAAEGLGSGDSRALGWALLIAIGVIVYLYKQNSDLRKDHAAELAALKKDKDAEIAVLNAKLLDTVVANAKDQRDLLQQIVPLAASLADAAEHLETLEGD